MELSFRKDYEQRNFFNSSATLNELNFNENLLDESIYPRVHLTSRECSFSQNGQTLEILNGGNGTRESYISMGKAYTFAAIDIDIDSQINGSGSASVMLSYYKNANNRIVINQRSNGSSDNDLTMDIIRNGVTVRTETPSFNGFSAPYTLRVHLVGIKINFYVIDSSGNWDHLKQYDISPEFDSRDKSLFDDYSVLVGARLGRNDRVSISKAQQYLTTGSGQADPKIIHYENGEPMIENDTLWVAMSGRGGELDIWQSIMEYNMLTKEWKVSGAIVFNKGDGFQRQWAAGDVFYDRNDGLWKAFPVSHREVEKGYIWHGSSSSDLRFGLNEVSVTPVNYPRGSQEEDATVLYDEDVGKWRMAMCYRDGGFQTHMFESGSWNGTWNRIAISTLTSTTGILIQKIGGTRYVFQGRGSGVGSMEVLSYPALNKVGELNLDVFPNGTNLWPAILPITKTGGTSYSLLTFDRSELVGSRTYGTIHWYEADQFADNFYEYTAPVPQANDASFITQTVPDSLSPGETATVSLYFKNIGIDTWSASNGHALSALIPAWGTNVVQLPHDVEPGDVVEYTFDITAPQVNGVFDFQWQMFDGSGANTGSFGRMSHTKSIVVGAASGLVKIYGNTGFGGWEASFTVGEFKLSDIIQAGGVDNDVDSVRVMSGYRVELFKNDNFGGEVLVRTSDDDNISEDGWHNVVSSLKVSAYSNKPVVSFNIPNTNLNAGDDLAVEVNAIDPDGIDRVRLYINGIELARSEGIAPYNWSAGQGDTEIMNLQEGNFVLTAKAYDNVGDVGEVSTIITVSSADPYTVWKQSYGVTDDSADNDNDGVLNIMEFALGGDPLVADAESLRPGVKENGNYLDYCFRREAESVTYIIQQSTDLVNWNDHIIVTDSHGLVGAECTIPVPLSGMSHGKLFLRLRVEK